jgi:thiol-disulfide isomerase/thioredoxin
MDDKLKNILLWSIGGIVMIGIIVVVVSGVSETADNLTDSQAEVEVTGEWLVPYQQGFETAAGAPIPEVSGTGLDGEPVSITNNGKAKAIVFLAHWCPNCQAEVPELVQWLNTNDVPDNVEIIGVATAISRIRSNYPPSDWLESEGWDVPTLLDDSDSTVSLAYGGLAFPGWAFVNADGTLSTRITGAGAVDLNVVIPLLAQGIDIGALNPGSSTPVPTEEELLEEAPSE